MLTTFQILYYELGLKKKDRIIPNIEAIIFWGKAHIFNALLLIVI